MTLSTKMKEEAITIIIAFTQIFAAIAVASLILSLL